jgi:kynurenine formamidase
LSGTDFDALFKRVCNWGRWGDDDEIGTLNLIDADAVKRGAAAVRTGRRFSLALPLDEKGPQAGFIPGRINPVRTLISLNSPWSDDVVTMGLQAGTHWDALAHVSHDGQLYNGFPATSTTVEGGASRCGIDKLPPIVTRGVLLDVARDKGVDRLDAGYGITGDDLESAAGRVGGPIEPGDVVLVRTGQVQLFHRRERKAYAGQTSGLTLSSAEWFYEHDVAAVATDTLTFEVYPSEAEELLVPVHILCLVAMGLTQGQNFDLEALGADCAGDGAYTFLLEATPQPFTGGLGSPVNPVVTK